MGKFRPYTEKDMPAVHLCAVKRKDNRFVHTIVGWNDSVVQLSSGFHHVYLDLLNNFTFLDGSPCGIEDGWEE